MAWISLNGKPRSMLLSLLLTGMLAGAGHAVAAPAPGQQTADLATAFEFLANQIPTHLYDVDALAEVLDYDVDAAVRHVTDEVAYEPYVGVLRGPAGTLSTGAGSVWDQAVLGAALVNAMAGEALLVEGTLAPADVDRLLQRAFLPRDATEPPIPLEQLMAAFDGLLPAGTLSRIESRLAAADPTAPDIDRQADRIARTLSTALAEAGRPLGQDGGTPLTDLRRRIGEHYVWIRYRDTPEDPWRDAHPAFGDAAPPEVKPERYLADEVPEAVEHRIEIRLDLERQSGDRTERLPLMAPYERPAANLAPVQIPIAIVPSGPSPSGEAPDFYLPLLHGALPDGAQAFTAAGLTADAADALGGPGVFAQMARTLGSGLGELSDGAGGQRLTGIVLTITHIAPGGTRTEEERRLADLREGAAGADPGRILMDGVIDVGVGRENGAREQRAYFLAQAEAMRALAGLGAALQTAEGPTLEDFSSGELTVPPRRWPEMLLLGGTLEPPPEATPAVFRSGPLVTMRRIARVPERGPLPAMLIDILHHPAVALRQTDGAAGYDASAVMRQGARETLLEALIVGRDVPEPWLTSGIDRVIASTDALSAWSAAAGVTPGVGERMAADLERTGVLMIPDATEDPRWWRVDPAGGAALGMGEAGGVSLTEELITEYILTIYGAIMLVNNIESCSKTYPDNDTMRNCCIAGQVLLYGSGMAAGGAAASAFAKAGPAAGVYFAGMVGYEAAQIPVGWGTDVLSDEVCKAVAR